MRWIHPRDRCGALARAAPWAPGAWIDRLAASAPLRAVRDGLLWLVPFLLFTSACVLLAAALQPWAAARPLAATLQALHEKLSALTPWLAVAAIGYMYAIPHHLPRLASALLCLAYAALAAQWLSAENLSTLLLRLLLTPVLPLLAIPALASLARWRRLRLVGSTRAGDHVRAALNLIAPGLIVGAVLGLGLTVLAQLAQLLPAPVSNWLDPQQRPLPAALTVAGLNSVLWLFGVHGYHGLFPLIERADMAPVAPLLGTFAFIGGSGATLSLVLAMLLLCRQGGLRLLAYTGLAVGLLGVNEVLLFGLPLILNLRFALPFILVPMANVLLAWGAISWGWVERPTVVLPFTSPVGLNAYWATGGDIAAVGLQLVLLALGAWIYAPFVRRHVAQEHGGEEIPLPSLETRYSPVPEESALMELDPFAQVHQQQARLAQRRQRLHEIARQRFALEFQPKLERASGRLAGCEALLRHLGPGGVLLSAHQHVFWLHEAGLSTALDLWVARAVAAQSAHWQREGLDIPVSINVSLDTLLEPVSRRALLDVLADAPARLALEVTEETFIRDAAQLAQAIEDIHAIGAEVHVDDFGTGYAALSHLHAFAIDAIKIDRSFVLAAQHPRGRLVLDGVLAVARQLELQVVVEGVETEAQWLALPAWPSVSVQGWYHSRSLGPEAMAAFARRTVRENGPAACGCGGPGRPAGGS